jgi:hypothetical protein
MTEEASTDRFNPDQPAGDPESGYRLNFDPSPSAIFHDFCGENKIEGASCPHCKKPLLRLLTLNTNDEALNIDPKTLPAVHLLYCWNCSIPFGEFSYKIENDGSVVLLQYPPRMPESEHGPDGPRDGYTGEFVHRRVSLDGIGQEEQARYKDFWNSIDADPYDCGVDTIGHQVGGFPFIYNPCRTKCPSCTEDMPLLASICDDATGNSPDSVSECDSFVGNCGVQMVFHFCRKCSIVTGYSSCD